MSWSENIKNGLQITTGDGQVWTPLIRIDSFTSSFDYNVSEFEFPEIQGTKVDRRLRKGVRYPMELHFVGDSCIIDGKAFVEASNNTKFWEVIHPIFGQFKGHPISIEMDATNLNVFIVKTTVVETILDEGAKSIFAPGENAALILNKAKETNNTAFVNSITAFTPKDVQQMSGTVETLYNETSGAITDQDTFNNYTNIYNVAQTKINTALNDVNFGVNYIQEFINLPAQFLIGVKSKLVLFKNQLIDLALALESLNNDYNAKKVYEFNAGALVGTIIETLATPQEGDYESAVDVFFVIEQALEGWNNYIDTLQGLQDSNGYTTGSYLPNAEFLQSLSYSFNYVIANLFEIAITAQQERSIILENDSNVILLTHRFYGLDQQDVNLERFIRTNNIGLTETFEVKKGRRIVYYV